jgi:hypothetical protein
MEKGCGAMDLLTLGASKKYTDSKLDALPATSIVEDSEHRFVTDVEIATWNAGGGSGPGTGDMLKAIYDSNNNGVVDQAAKLQTARTITLTGDASGSVSFDGSANASITVVVADDSHVHTASTITEDSTHRFVTDAEKATWNAGGGGGGITIVSNISLLPTPSATYRGREYLVQGAANVWEVNSLTINNPCTTSGNVTITLDGVAKTVALTTAQNTATLVATAIRAASFPGWITGGSGTTVTFTATLTTVGNKTNGVYSAGSTGATSTAGMTTPITGVAASPDTHYICVKMGDDTYGWRRLHDIVINVGDYGAKFDGVTDDTSSIKRAVNALKFDTVELGGYIRNRRLVFPAGVYKITDEIIIPFMTGFIIEGESRGSTWIVQYTANKPIFTFSVALTHSWEVRDLSLSYNSVQPVTNTRAVHIFFEAGAADGFFEMNIENVTFYGGYYAIAINRAIQLAVWGFTARKCSFWDQSGGTIQLCPEIAVGQPIIKLEDLYIRADLQTERCIFIGYCDSVLLDSVEINKGNFGPGYPQIEITGCYNVTMLNCRAEQSTINTGGGNYFFWNFSNSTVDIIGCTITNIPISGGGSTFLVNCNSPDGLASPTTGKLMVNGLIADAALLNGGNVYATKADDFICAAGLRVFSPVQRYDSSWTPRIDADRAQRMQSVDAPDANVVLVASDLPYRKHNQLTANRTVTLPSTGLFDGLEFTILKHNKAAFTLTVIDPIDGTNTVLAINTRGSVTYRVFQNLKWHIVGYSPNMP